MKEIIEQFVTNITTYLSALGPISGVILILLESIFPVLPLSVFIALNIMAFGSIFGYLISLISTIVGCLGSFFLFRSCFQKKLYEYIKRKDSASLDKMMKTISKISFSNLVLLIAIPFSPAFLINIAAGLSKITKEKFFFSLVIGKSVMVYFWGYIGKSLLESLTDVTTLVRVSVLLLISFIVSRVVEKRMRVR